MDCDLDFGGHRPCDVYSRQDESAAQDSALPGVVKLAYDKGPYGTYQLSVSGFSDVLQSFGGGNGQIALHGTNRPELLGQPVSNGCVRLSNDAINRLAWLAPTGTPVEIVA